MDKLVGKAPSAIKIRFAALSVLIAASVAAAGCSMLPKDQASLKPPLIKPAQAEIRTIEAKPGSIVRQVAGSGAFVPTKITYYQFKSGGVIQSVNVGAGKAVKRGDVLVTLENDNVDVELLQRELDYERKKQALDDAIKAGDQRNVRLDRLDFKIAELLYDKTKQRAESGTLRAQADGVISYATDLQPADHVDANRVLAAIADPTRMRLALQAGSNPALADIKVGMEAEISFKGKSYKGKVMQTPSSAPPTEDPRLRDEYGKTLYVEVEELPSGAVFGAMADVKIVAARRDNVIVLPKSAVRTYFGRTFVQVLEGERRKENDIETGLETASEYEIVEGVKEGMKIILP
jgi:multidrug efflux pump subunit AcrA (membrane-fusion protein)